MCTVYGKFFCLFLKTLFYFWLRWVFLAAPGLSLVAVRGLLIVVASLVVEQKFQGTWASGVVACGLECRTSSFESRA